MSSHTPRPEDFRLHHRVRVRWAEVDAQNVVFNGHYLGLADLGSTEYWRALTLPYPYAFDRMGGDVVVRKAGLEFLGSARFDDWIDVGVRCARVGRSSIGIDWAIFRQHALLAHGDLVYVFIDAGAGVATSVPELLRDAIEAYEAGQPMLRVRSGDWGAMGADARALRHEVFVEEQGIDAELEDDVRDPEAWHAVAYNRAGWGMGTARVLRPEHDTLQLGRVAVRKAMRGSGVGRLLIDRLTAIGAEQGCARILMHAQTHAAGFFGRLGFEREGEVFLEAGLPHVTMAKRLR